MQFACAKAKLQAKREKRDRGRPIDQGGAAHREHEDDRGGNERKDELSHGGLPTSPRPVSRPSLTQT